MLSIKQLNKTYANGVKAINDVSLQIPNGMFGLLGPNGAGKSSLMHTISTLQDPDRGNIHFHGFDVLKDKEGLRRQLGYPTLSGLAEDMDPSIALPAMSKRPTMQSVAMSP